MLCSPTYWTHIKRAQSETVKGFNQWCFLEIKRNVRPKNEKTWTYPKAYNHDDELHHANSLQCKRSICFIQTFGRQKDDYTNTVYLEEKTKRLSEFRRLKPRSCVNKGIQGKQQRFNLPRIKTVLKCVPSCENGLNLYSSIPSNLRISLVIESST